LKPVEFAGLLRLVDTVPGMSDRDKINAVTEMMRHAPPGDVVEIGSWWGRSAALFVWLARRYGVGPVLCVDPWLSEALPQGVAVLDRASAAHDTDEALRIFEINLAPLAQGGLNYLRAYSAQGAARYGAGLEVETEVFGRTAYTGEIAVLHIDGNHAYERVEEDARLWTPHVKPGGWIIFDDYVWAFGDGPRRVGDAFLRDESHRIALSFVIGTALFVQLAA
jgi:cephalosporin hydroxylase